MTSERQTRKAVIMVYINPIPYIDVAKEYEIRIKLVSDEVIEYEKAKIKCAEHIKSLSIDELCQIMSVKIFAVYPDK